MLFNEQRGRAVAVTNNEAMRDLSGRRVRHVVNEQKLAEWEKGKEERELAIQGEKAATRIMKQQAIQNKIESYHFQEKAAQARDIVSDAFSDSSVYAAAASSQPLEGRLGGKRRVQFISGSSSSSSAAASSSSADDEQVEHPSKRVGSMWATEFEAGSDEDDDEEDEASEEDVKEDEEDDDNAKEEDEKGVEKVDSSSSSEPIEVHQNQEESSNSETQRPKEELASPSSSVSFDVSLPAEPAAVVPVSEPLPSSSSPSSASSHSESSPSLSSFDMTPFSSASELAALGMQQLSDVLKAKGLKAGGSLEERASRLFSVKGLSDDQIPRKLKANSK